MTAARPGRLVILSGPSCVGKSPLATALARFHPDLSANLQPIVLFNSRSPRLGERDGEDYHFRSRAQIEPLRDQKRYVVMHVRGELQALDVEDLSALLTQGDAFFEGNPFIGRTLQTHPKLQGVNRLSMFLAPVSQEEILVLRNQAQVSLPDFVTDVPCGGTPSCRAAGKLAGISAVSLNELLGPTDVDAGMRVAHGRSYRHAAAREERDENDLDDNRR